MELTPNQRQELRAALISAFPQQPRLELMVEDELGEDLNQITQGQSDYELVVRALVKWADSQGRLRELVIGASQKNPGNPELKAFSQVFLEDVLQKLFSLLSLINFDTVSSAYRLCLEGRIRETPATLSALIAQLADIPGEPDEPKPLCRFVSLLIQEQSLASDQQQALWTWAEAQGLSPVIAASKPKASETYLMVKVQPRSLNDPALGYLVTAAVVKDLDPFDLRAKPISTQISIPEGTNPKCSPGYSQDELPQVLSELIAICGGRLHKIPLTDLTVQWFLPLELLSLPVEHWQIRIGRNQQPCNGERCKAVIVRSYDRHFPPYADAYESVVGEWEKAWQRLLDYSETLSDQALAPLDPMTKQIAIDWNQPKVVGCHFIESAEPQHQENFWDNLLAQGSPIALWLRQAGTPPQVAVTMMQSVKKCPIAELPLSLTRQRQTVLSMAAGPDRLMAAPISLLWDNPFRPFPTIEYHST